MATSNPLASRKSVTLEDLQPYPCLSFDQGENRAFYLAEEVYATYNYRQLIKASDRATMLNLMVGLNGYTISSGIISSELNDDKIIAIPLEVDDMMTLGYLMPQQVEPSPITRQYLDLLRANIRGYGFEILEDKDKEK